MLQRILKFGSEHWIRGLSPSEYYDGGSAIYTGEGVNIFRTSGRLSTGFLPTIIGSGTIADNIRWMVSDDFENTLMYAYGDTGKIYKININDTVSVLKDTITSSNGNGLIFYKDKLIYAIGTIVGKCSNPDSSTPTFDDDGINGGAVMLGVANHPMKVGADQKCYVGNSYKLAMFSDVASTPSADWDASKLTFQETYRINSLENDGFYLVIGLTTDSRVAQPRSYVAYWDMVSGQVNRWYQIPKCGEIQYLFCQEGQTYIFTKTAIYVSNFDTPPKLWFYRNDIICGGGNGAIATELNGELRWGGGNEITSYGSGGLNLPKVFYQPEKISVISTITSIFSNPEKNRFFVA